MTNALTSTAPRLHPLTAMRTCTQTRLPLCLTQLRNCLSIRHKDLVPQQRSVHRLSRHKSHVVPRCNRVFPCLQHRSTPSKSLSILCVSGSLPPPHSTSLLPGGSDSRTVGGENYNLNFVPFHRKDRSMNGICYKASDEPSVVERAACLAVSRGDCLRKWSPPMEKTRRVSR